jgi:hypothetical protein
VRAKRVEASGPAADRTDVHRDHRRHEYDRGGNQNALPRERNFFRGGTPRIDPAPQEEELEQET